MLDFLDEAVSDERLDKITIFCSPRAVRDFELPITHKIIMCDKDMEERSYVRRILWSQRGIANECQSIGAEVFLAMTGIGIGGDMVPSVTFIQQSLPFCAEVLAMQKTVPRLRLYLLRYLMKQSCRSSRYVIVQSPFMQNWLMKAFNLNADQLQVQQPGPRVLPSEGGKSYAVQPMNATRPNSRILYIGSSSPHKNVKILSETMPLVRRKLPGARLFATLPHGHPICDGDQIMGLGYLDGAALGDAYALASVLVQPSIVELSLIHI